MKVSGARDGEAVLLPPGQLKRNLRRAHRSVSTFTHLCRSNHRKAVSAIDSRVDGTYHALHLTRGGSAVIGSEAMLETLATRMYASTAPGAAGNARIDTLPCWQCRAGVYDRASPVSVARRARILAELADADGAVTAVRLGEVCKSVTGVAGAGIMLASGDQPVGALCATGEVSALIEELQYTLGEGPCVDAYRTDVPVLEPDLANPVVPRWLAFTGPALDAGVRAVFGFPLRVGTARLGALDLYSDAPGSLSDDQYADAEVMAGIAAETVLAMQAGESTGVLATELEEGSNFRFVVHQAAGMVSAQLDVSVAQALVRLRAHAFANQRPLADVAVDVVARRLRFPDGDA